MIWEEMLDQVKEENPNLASQARIFCRRIEAKEKAQSIGYCLNLPLRLFSSKNFLPNPQKVAC